jgi:hypothetical protein
MYSTTHWKGKPKQRISLPSHGRRAQLTLLLPLYHILPSDFWRDSTFSAASISHANSATKVIDEKYKKQKRHGNPLAVPEV